MYSKIPDAARSMKLTMRTPAWKKPKADTPIEGHMLADPETSVPTGSTHLFSRKSSPRMNQNDTQPAAPTYRIVSFIEVPWPETAHERFHAAESILSRPDCNLSPIGERAWRKYRTAVEGWIQSWKPRYWAYCFDPGYAEDFFHINPEQLDCVQRRCYNIIAEHDRHRVSRTAFIQDLTKEQNDIMRNVLCLYKSLYYAQYGTAVRAACKQKGEKFETRPSLTEESSSTYRKSSKPRPSISDKSSKAKYPTPIAEVQQLQSSIPLPLHAALTRWKFRK